MAASRRSLVILAAAAGAAAIAAAWLAPASLVDSRLARITEGRLRLADATGTIWRAHGNLVAGSTRMPIAWRLDAWPLLRGELHIHLAPDANTVTGAPRADIAIAGDRVSFRDVDATFPAAFFAAATGSAGLWVPGGEVRVNAAALTWAPPSSDGEARVQWRQARLGAVERSGGLDLGDVSLVLKANGDRLVGPVVNEGGDLAVRGEIALHATDGLEISLLLAPRRADDANLAQALAVLGVPEAGGWRVQWRQPRR